MKKLAIVLMLFLLLPLAAACGPPGTADARPQSHIIDSLPADMDFSGKTVPLKRITFFESYGNHGYTGYIVVAMSRENLSDDDIHWMTKMDPDSVNTEMSISIYLDGGENSLDKSAHLLKKVYNSEELYYIFETGLERYTFKGTAVRCLLTSSPVSIIDPSTTDYYYAFDIDNSHYSNSIESLTSDERSALIDALAN